MPQRPLECPPQFPRKRLRSACCEAYIGTTFTLHIVFRGLFSWPKQVYAEMLHSSLDKVWLVVKVRVEVVVVVFEAGHVVVEGRDDARLGDDIQFD